MLTVHHLENSRSQRVLWMLEELGADYEIKRYERDKKTSLAPAALKQVHPLGKSPVLEDDGVIVAETGAIIEYLVDKFDGALAPTKGSADYLRYRYWVHAAEGSYMPPMVFTLFLNRMETAPMPFFARPIAKKLTGAVRAGYLNHTVAALFGYLNDELGNAPWLVGDNLTAADIMMSFPMEGLAARGDLSAYPNIAACVDRIQSREAYKRAIEKGGPYALMR